MNNQRILNASFEKARYYLARNLSLLSAVLLCTIGTLYWLEADYTAYPMLIGGLVLFGTYFYLIKRRKYRWPAIISLCLLTLISLSNFSVSSNFHHIGDFFWIICVLTSSFFLLGKQWGIALLVVNLLGIFVLFYGIRHGYIHQLKKPYTWFSEVNFLINLSIGGALYSYLILAFLKEMRKIAQKYSQANAKLKNLNQEKSVMLREIHHRVKNNLQIITSLLRLQLSDIEEEETEHHFSEAINRILAISKIHEKMYRNHALNRIDLVAYLEDLVHDLITSYSGQTPINTTIESNVSSIPPKNLVPLALIFNELVTNSIKHAFDEVPTGEITISAFVNGKNKVRINYSDNGKWKEPDSKSNSIGLELIASFVDQLDGQMNLDKSNGTHYSFYFDIGLTEEQRST